MDDYISREAFKRKYLCCGYLPEMPGKEFDEFPAADVEPVVRCRECKHWCFETGLCNLHSNFSKSVLHFFDEYDFCSYGERKEGAD